MPQPGLLVLLPYMYRLFNQYATVFRLQIISPTASGNETQPTYSTILGVSRQ